MAWLSAGCASVVGLGASVVGLGASVVGLGASVVGLVASVVGGEDVMSAVVISILHPRFL